METLTLILLLAVAGAINILCFMIGAKVGQQTAKGETVRLPELNPLKEIREAKAKAEAEREYDRRATILANIEQYNGTSEGQKDVPGR